MLQYIKIYIKYITFIYLIDFKYSHVSLKKKRLNMGDSQIRRESDRIPRGFLQKVIFNLTQSI